LLAKAYLWGMKYVVLLVLALQIVACKAPKSNSPRQTDFLAIKALEDSLGANKFNPTMAARIAEKQVLFAKTYPTDSTAAQMLLNATSLRKATGQLKPALEAINLYIRSYPSHPMMPEALLLRGYTLEDLGQVEEAKKQYKAIAEAYPDTEHAKTANQLLAMTGQDLNKLIEQFEQKNK
jgi:outer membrane protein assembly factor BamD (BamD/ComL family)